ncbi:class I SAM-dependent methyltransferase [Amycolatopsis sp. CA-230715]|uniref:class I SAM-dependent methyltransferase n=1 Tax=Amycolatopsis sp. CA-230715 TaxID=2745196 RepID=UPI001C038B7E|nr:class I SAM-dependent methyltransferase [Amycolatopsis sp. CA-230715]QWF76913.1 Ubiquinone/menaquinone biosynthesis C-methyltransferase UbiE [Amycolatopsis sp. CA-230715]
MRERYGIDAPGVFAAFGVLGAVCTIAAVVAAVAADGPVWTVVALVLAVWAAASWAQFAWGVLGSLLGKRREWRRLLDGVRLKGTERVLEVGPGTGPVLVEVARRVPMGRVVGADIWRAQDQAGNSRAALEANLAAAGVGDRVEVVHGDVRDLPFPDGEFDVVLASLVVHNLPEGERETAIRELHRVLAPGGRLVILDFQGTEAYARALREDGAEDVRRGGRLWSMHPPARAVTALRAR